jgi:hypothetical protein
METDRQSDIVTRHRSEYNSPSTIPFFITIVIIKEGRAKKGTRNGRMAQEKPTRV